MPWFGPLRGYIIVCSITLLYDLTDEPLKYLFEKPVISGILARWHLLLPIIQITYATQKSRKGHAIADHLAENPVEGYETMWTFFPMSP